MFSPIQKCIHLVNFLKQKEPKESWIGGKPNSLFLKGSIYFNVNKCMQNKFYTALKYDFTYAYYHNIIQCMLL